MKKLLGFLCIALGVALFFAFPRSRSDGYRNHNFPDTFVSKIHIDLTAPDYWVTLSWSGPEASEQDRGPFHCSPGAGWGTNDCDDVVESNTLNSRCTPKGTRPVEGFLKHLRSNPEARYVTLIDARRGIGIHRSPDVPPRPASQGCVRMSEYPARLIYDNSIAKVTSVVVGGQWSLPEPVSSQ